MPGNNNYSGQIIGNYTVLERLGSGEFGSVYRAQNRFVVERVVAIKLINDRYVSSREECEHFLHEARVLQKLQHPYILPIFDIGEHQGVPYIVIEYAPSGSLRTYLQNLSGGQLPLNRALAVLSQVGQALHYAHLQRVVHRDMKPENILFSSKEVALLADFGIATEMPTSTIRNRDTITGTPPYMAPEQFEGMFSKLSDQYALGCIAYELVTGRKPFQANDIVSWAFKHTQEIPVPPRQINPEIPVEVERAILKAMAKERTQRFPDVGAFVEALAPDKTFATVATQSVLKTATGKTTLANIDLTIGRAPDNMHVISDPQVSGHHAVIRHQSQGHVLFDLNSTNKTYVNEREIPAQTPYVLRQGDTIRIGPTTFEYTYDVVTPGSGPITPIPDAELNRRANPPVLPLVETVAMPATPPPGAPPPLTPQPGQPFQSQPGQQYPSQPGQQYPSQPGQFYQSQPGQPYQSQPGQSYPSQPGQFYPSQPGQTYPPQSRQSRPGLVAVLAAISIVLIIALVGGGALLVSHLNSPTPTPLVVVPTPTPIPTAIPTPTPLPTSPPATLPALFGRYAGSITDNSGGSNVMTLTEVQEDQENGSIRGTVQIASPFDFSGTAEFGGTVGTNSGITFSFTLTNGVDITFVGAVSSDNTILRGQYTGNDGESGTWSVSTS